eukprot:scaffold27315_cov169-Skeletonema_dohrnii-CCMP3373.AAC.1
MSQVNRSRIQYRLAGMKTPSFESSISASLSLQLRAAVPRSLSPLLIKGSNCTICSRYFIIYTSNKVRHGNLHHVARVPTFIITQPEVSHLIIVMILLYTHPPGSE